MSIQNINSNKMCK